MLNEHPIVFFFVWLLLFVVWFSFFVLQFLHVLPLLGYIIFHLGAAFTSADFLQTNDGSVWTAYMFVWAQEQVDFSHVCTFCRAGGRQVTIIVADLHCRQILDDIIRRFHLIYSENCFNLSVFEPAAPHLRKLTGFSLFLLAVSAHVVPKTCGRFHFKAGAHVQITAGSHSSFSCLFFLIPCVEVSAACLQPFAVGQSQKWHFVASQSSGSKVKSVGLCVHALNPASVLFPPTAEKHRATLRSGRIHVCERDLIWPHSSCRQSHHKLLKAENKGTFHGFV